MPHGSNCLKLPKTRYVPRRSSRYVSRFIFVQAKELFPVRPRNSGHLKVSIRYGESPAIWRAKSGLGSTSILFISEVDLDVAPHLGEAYPFEGRALGERFVLLFREVREVFISKPEDLFSCPEEFGRRRSVVKGAYVLTGVAAIETRAEVGSELLRYLAPVLDSQVTDALPGVQPVCRKGSSWASVHAAPARPAVCSRLVRSHRSGLERHRGHKLTEEKEAPFSPENQ